MFDRSIAGAKMVFCFTILLSAWGQQPEKSKLDLTQQYLLLATARTSTMQKEIDEAAAAGYRVLGGCRTGGGELALLLEKGSDALKACHYKLLATQKTSTMQKEIDEVAARGFRLLPRTMMGGEDEVVLVLEKEAGSPTPCQYLLLATTRTGTLQKEMKEASDKGFRVIGMVSRKEHMVILERRAGDTGEPAPQSKPDLSERFLLLATERTSTMQKELTKAAKAGHRVLAASPTSITEIMMILEKSAQSPQLYEYKLLATNKSSTLEKELNDAAAQGFRLRRETVAGKRGTGGGWRSLTSVGLGGMGELQAVAAPDEICSVVEKAPNSPNRYQYRVLGTMRTSTMQQELMKASSEGFEIAAMAGSPGTKDQAQLMGVMANLVIVLEKQVAH